MDDHSFKPPMFDIEKYPFQEKAILNYLGQELSTEKHPWLDKEDIETLSNQAKENPFSGLAMWQEITDDHSFKPPTQEDLNLALAALDKVGNYLNFKQQSEWKQLAQVSPNEVIDSCNKLLEDRQAILDEKIHDEQCEIAASKFISYVFNVKEYL